MVRSQKDESVMSSDDDVKETRKGGNSEKVRMRNDQKQERGDKEKQNLNQNNKNQINKHIDHQLMKKYSQDKNTAHQK